LLSLPDPRRTPTSLVNHQLPPHFIQVTAGIKASRPFPASTFQGTAPGKEKNSNDRVLRLPPPDHVLFFLILVSHSHLLNEVLILIESPRIPRSESLFYSSRPPSPTSPNRKPFMKPLHFLALSVFASLYSHPYTTPITRLRQTLHPPFATVPFPTRLNFGSHFMPPPGHLCSPYFKLLSTQKFLLIIRVVFLPVKFSNFFESSNFSSQFATSF